MLSSNTETKEWLTGIISHVCIDCQSSNIESVDHVGVPFFPVACVVQDVVESLCCHVLAHDSHLRGKTDIGLLTLSNLKNFSIAVEYKVHKVCSALKNLLQFSLWCFCDKVLTDFECILLPGRWKIKAFHCADKGQLSFIHRSIHSLIFKSPAFWVTQPCQVTKSKSWHSKQWI